MPVRIVRFGSPRARDEGVRLGTVRYPPRGVPKAELAARDFYDVWLPALAPSTELLRWAKDHSLVDSWPQFSRRYLREMASGDAAHLLDALAALARQTNFTVGCYCPDAAHCHRSLLRRLFEERGVETA